MRTLLLSPTWSFAALVGVCAMKSTVFPHGYDRASLLFLCDWINRISRACNSMARLIFWVLSEFSFPPDCWWGYNGHWGVYSLQCCSKVSAVFLSPQVSRCPSAISLPSHISQDRVLSVSPGLILVCPSQSVFTLFRHLASPWHCSF